MAFPPSKWLYSALRAAAVCVAVVAAAPLKAQSEPSCDAATTQQEMNDCTAQAYGTADDALNDAWKSAREFGEAIGQGEALLIAQRTWLAYRDAACSAHASPYEGGSLHGMIEMNCKTTLTEERTRMLFEFNAY
ncbi:lysozyme inhibitor LprI family protein [Sulfitobacter guttiformis]|uniref:Uncharacterized protein YecT (DUF1311 family) n=1 Tax=Sulfitobacter guttiformis TaxID=74349 RepID=A0A420DJI2_9RHOB|nr:lysozyme inhibitor LprI family protein [Sulfitobacter guttiformis]KIN71807.1 putative urease-associated protein [Sulfitobacter guttiformis KCTC 32187]RKE94377.1 uncharacterized protein YecT (DUF1311 family) [Sulfitobacter guttiformis]